MDSVVITAFASAPIMPIDILNMLNAVILTTGVFQLEYTKCHVLPTGQRTILNTWDCWAKKVILRLQFQEVACNMNRGMEY